MGVYRFTNFLVLAGVKLSARFFYHVENQWLHEHEGDPWKNVTLIAFLNHTSLYEPLFLGAAPWRLLWRIAGRMIIPAADVTMDRPFVGKLLRLIVPRHVPISRERDETWDNFLEEIEDDSIVAILPEGRMMRADGLDKHGKPMTVRGGVADILEIMATGEMVIIYSGGLHHVQMPGQGLPKFFKHIRIRCERISIEEYVQQMKAVPDTPFKKAVVQDLELRMEQHKPQ